MDFRAKYLVTNYLVSK